jgi:hypothetical protein
MGAVRMSAQERAPSFDRLHPLRNSIVQILIDIRRSGWIDGGHAHFPLCGRERLVDVTLMSSSHRSFAMSSWLSGA